MCGIVQRSVSGLYKAYINTTFKFTPVFHRPDYIPLFAWIFTGHTNAAR